MQSVLRAPSLTAHGFLHGFSTRHGGVSAPPFATLNLGAVGSAALGLATRDDPAHLLENQRRFAAALGYRPERLFTVSQVHGRSVRVLNPEDQPERVRIDQADALVCAAKPEQGALAIAIRTADCVPVLLADPETRAVAAVHGGWRGLVAGILGESVRALCEVTGGGGAVASRLVAVIFPHIAGCCFEVGEEVALQLAAAAGPEVVLREASRPKPHVALERVARVQLMAAGIAAPHIESVAGCTSCDAERFFSFRRDGQATGRHWAAIVAG